jgi:hypothetical protein
VEGNVDEKVEESDTVKGYRLGDFHLHVGVLHFCCFALP